MEKLFREEVLVNKRHRLEGAVSLVQAPVFKKLTFLILFIVFISIFFLSIGTYVRKERVAGVIEPSFGLIRLESPLKGVVSEVLVKDGDYVVAGQTILRIASAKHSKQELELNQALLNQYSIQINTLDLIFRQQQLQDKLTLAELEQKKSNTMARLMELDNQYEIFLTRLELNKQMVKQIYTLKGSGHISDLDLQRQKDNLLSMKQQASNIKFEKLTLIGQIKQIQSQLQKLPLEQSNRLSQFQDQRSNLQIQIATIEQQRLGELRAPTSGTISGLLAKSNNNVRLGQSLLTILPKNSHMQAVLYIPTSAFGFIEQGQKTRIRYHAFPYQKFGIYSGTITEISHSVIFPDETNTPGIISKPAYRVVVALDAENIQAYGKKPMLRPGMLLDADIVIEERSLLRWLFDPIFSIHGQL
ncbi:MAG: HlyD family efflux transporter periplasmic adaptor subunit [Psychrobium sp.]|nr:HlyD family efflux transporter periplasmic adaptor subunit [Psychrobium sp.]